MSDVPQRPRIRPATSDDWHKGSNESAGQSLSYGNDADRSSADFDNSTYYEYLERHTGEQSTSKARSGNVFAPAGHSPFDPAHSSGSAQHSLPQQAQRSADGGAGGSAGSGQQTPPPPQFPPTVHSESSSRNGLKISVVIIAIIMILALVGFFGIRWLAPSSGTVPVDVGSSEPASPSPSPSEDLVQPSQSPQQRLDAYTEQGSRTASDLEGQWVSQVSAKNVGLEADGKTWSAQDILNEYEANKVKYPGAILIHSGDWASYKGDSYWVTVVDTGYSDPEPALDQCRSWGLDRNHCLAKRLVKDGSPKDNSAYLDE
ncbi:MULTISPECIES: protein kinase [unclassified Brevibacterium]|uniref:protein kinase n=1 Tax=unclassified Brevibacterium TaxID=2614124 RepID=UPI001091CD26|nr:protein kinase [Brevibacterium sp. S22]TGD31674.1 protein kinase [Brevibacterium sp. S22]